MARMAIAVHGGAGPLRRADAPAGREVRAALARALAAGRERLESGAPALDAVVAAAGALEDDPAFNAGRGSVLTEEGTVEMDAAVMRGDDRAIGAVAAVRRVRRPIELARAVLERGRDAVVCSEAAERLASALGLETASEEELIVERQLERWHRRRGAASPARLDERPAQPSGASSHGTVGAVALDAAGGLAAATSTGGRAGQATGRIGDSPIPGAGTWADASTCAVSCTGDGEAIIRAACAHEAHVRLREGLSLADAAEAALAELSRCGGEGGLIALGRDGEIAMPYTTEAMSRGWWTAGGEPRTDAS